MRNTKRRVGSLVLKIETNGLQILVQREILHKYSHLQVLFDKKKAHLVHTLIMAVGS